MSDSTAHSPNRRDIYYWKVDRSEVFRPPRPQLNGQELTQLTADLQQLLRRRLSRQKLILHPGGGVGSQLTFLAKDQTETWFVRVDDGQEQDNYLELAGHLHDVVRQSGVPTPVVHLADASRQELPVAFQVIEYFPYPDLNRWHKQGELSLLTVAEQIGRYVARWQSIQPPGFGLFDSLAFQQRNELTGLHADYESYYCLNWRQHLDALVSPGFLSRAEADNFSAVVTDHAALLKLDQSCLVHKDLALWNALGTPDEVKAVIDWDDVIAGDPTDDLSLLACFHTEDVLAAAMCGYETIRPLPENFAPRFWLHLLRNMVVKAVIRVHSGYFKQNNLFLMSPGGTGQSLEAATRERLSTAYEGLRESLPVAQSSAKLPPEM